MNVIQSLLSKVEENDSPDCILKMIKNEVTPDSIRGVSEALFEYTLANEELDGVYALLQALTRLSVLNKVGNCDSLYQTTLFLLSSKCSTAQMEILVHSFLKLTNDFASDLALLCLSTLNEKIFSFSSQETLSFLPAVNCLFLSLNKLNPSFIEKETETILSLVSDQLFEENADFLLSTFTFTPFRAKLIEKCFSSGSEPIIHSGIAYLPANWVLSALFEIFNPHLDTLPASEASNLRESTNNKFELLLHSFSETQLEAKIPLYSPLKIKNELIYTSNHPNLPQTQSILKELLTSNKTTLDNFTTILVILLAKLFFLPDSLERRVVLNSISSFENPIFSIFSFIQSNLPSPTLIILVKTVLLYSKFK